MDYFRTIKCRSSCPPLFSSPRPHLPKCTFSPFQSVSPPDFWPEGRRRPRRPSRTLPRLSASPSRALTARRLAPAPVLCRSRADTPVLPARWLGHTLARRSSGRLDAPPPPSAAGWLAPRPRPQAARPGRRLAGHRRPPLLTGSPLCAAPRTLRGALAPSTAHWLAPRPPPPCGYDRVLMPGSLGWGFRLAGSAREPKGLITSGKLHASLLPNFPKCTFSP